MNQLRDFFEKGDHRIIDKWDHYFDIYDKYLSGFRGRKVNILEIGISHGGSLQMWKDYFGPDSTIYGVDINPECKKFEEDGIKVFIGSQSDRNFLRSIKEEIPRPDILIDDGGHMMNQQIITFQELFDYVKDNGIYICEDLHTSYWLSHGGGCKRRGTFIEFAKDLIDDINAWHSRQKGFKINNYTRSVKSLHFYDSILIIEKDQLAKPISIKKGRSGIMEDNNLVEKTSFITTVSNHLDSISANLKIPKRF